MDYAQRLLAETEIELITQLYELMARWMPTHAFVTAAQSVSMVRWERAGDDEPVAVEVAVPPGTTLKVVGLTRCGRCMLTDDLAAEFHGRLELPLDHAALVDFRRNPVAVFPVAA